jgi:hypothetical protein
MYFILKIFTDILRNLALTLSTQLSFQSVLRFGPCAHEGMTENLGQKINNDIDFFSEFYRRRLNRSTY